MVLTSIYWQTTHDLAIVISGLRTNRVDVVNRKPLDDIRSVPWPSLEQLGFDDADAWLPIHGTEHDKYVFYGTSFGRVTVQLPHGNTTKADGPWKITEKLTSLTQAGFDTVDAALNVPGKKHQVYFFRGTKYVKVHLEDDRLVKGPKSLAHGWPELANAGFDAVDTAVEVPGTANQVIFFRGKKSITVEIVSGGDNRVVKGPESILTDWNGAFDWLSKR